jgi:hypothetical protein
MCKATYPNIASSSKICKFQQTVNITSLFIFCIGTFVVLILKKLIQTALS